jgi:hypothetical protein
MVAINVWGQGSGRVTIINHNLYCDAKVQLTAFDPGFRNGDPCAIKTNIFTVRENSSTPTWTPADIAASGPGFAPTLNGAYLVNGAYLINTNTFSWTDIQITYHCDECKCPQPLSGEINLAEMLLLPNQCNSEGVQAAFNTGCFSGPHTWTNVSNHTPMGDIRIDLY